MAFEGFSNNGILFGNSSLTLANICTIYADISRTVKDMSSDISLYTDIYKTTTDPSQKIALGNKLINMVSIQGGIMATLINNPVMLQVDISATLKFASECKELITEMEHLLTQVEKEQDRFNCITLIADAKNLVYQHKLWIYRFIDISSLLGVF